MVSPGMISSCVTPLRPAHFWWSADACLVLNSQVQNQISQYHLLISSKDGQVQCLTEENFKTLTGKKTVKFNPFDYLQKGNSLDLSQAPMQYWERQKNYHNDAIGRENHA